MTTGPRDAPEEFLRALRSLRGVSLRAEVELEEAPGPARIAPYTAALVAEVHGSRRDPDADELASGRFVVLHDPAGQEAWEGAFRLVTLVRSTLEPEVGQDPMLAEVAWSWFSDALAGQGVDARAAGGTGTRVLSQSLGRPAPRRGAPPPRGGGAGPRGAAPVVGRPGRAPGAVRARAARLLDRPGRGPGPAPARLGGAAVHRRRAAAAAGRRRRARYPPLTGPPAERAGL